MEMFLTGGVVATGLIWICLTIVNSLQGGPEVKKEKPFTAKFPKGATNLANAGTDYSTYDYEGKKILVYKPGTDEMSMTVLSS